MSIPHAQPLPLHVHRLAFLKSNNLPPHTRALQVYLSLFASSLSSCPPHPLKSFSGSLRKPPEVPTISTRPRLFRLSRLHGRVRQLVPLGQQTLDIHSVRNPIWFQLSYPDHSCLIASLGSIWAILGSRFKPCWSPLPHTGPHITRDFAQALINKQPRRYTVRPLISVVPRTADYQTALVPHAPVVPGFPAKLILQPISALI